ncbi:MAG TPA: VOC family protein [Opitutaceae bacterium]|jgi:hypothetical protein|nr:VOC family protein [Opitutaceae bacterium]
MDRTNKIIYIEFQTADLAKTKAFFTAAFGWTFKDYGPDYASFEEQDPAVSGGICRSSAQGSIAAGGPLVVLFNQQLEAACDKVVAEGGRITKPIFSYPGGRRFHFVEPGGNELAVCSIES